MFGLVLWFFLSPVCPQIVPPGALPLPPGVVPLPGEPNWWVPLKSDPSKVGVIDDLTKR